jgi:putative transposase
MKARLVVAAIEMAVARRGGDVAGCIVHSDRGSQFRARKVQRALTRHGMVGSMGQVGSAGDNAAMESFFALLQKNVFDRRTLEHPRRAPHRDRHLDRTHLPPTPTPSPPSAD